MTRSLKGRRFRASSKGVACASKSNLSVEVDCVEAFNDWSASERVAASRYKTSTVRSQIRLFCTTVVSKSRRVSRVDWGNLAWQKRKAWNTREAMSGRSGAPSTEPLPCALEATWVTTLWASIPARLSQSSPCERLMPSIDRVLTSSVTNATKLSPSFKTRSTVRVRVSW